MMEFMELFSHFTISLYDKTGQQLIVRTGKGIKTEKKVKTNRTLVLYTLGKHSGHTSTVVSNSFGETDNSIS